MIFVDTSVWVSFFRGKPEDPAERLAGLLDEDRVALAAPVRIEILSGVSAKNLPRLRCLLSALPVFYPDRSTWERMETWTERASVQGERFGFGDLMIGAIATQHDGEVWSFDADFARLHKLGFLRTYAG